MRRPRSTRAVEPWVGGGGGGGRKGGGGKGGGKINEK